MVHLIHVDAEILQVVTCVTDPTRTAVVPWTVECGNLPYPRPRCITFFPLFCPVKMTQTV
jgi:hypothetical protein